MLYKTVSEARNICAGSASFASTPHCEPKMMSWWCFCYYVEIKESDSDLNSTSCINWCGTIAIIAILTIVKLVQYSQYITIESYGSMTHEKSHSVMFEFSHDIFDYQCNFKPNNQKLSSGRTICSAALLSHCFPYTNRCLLPCDFFPWSSCISESERSASFRYWSIQKSGSTVNCVSSSPPSSCHGRFLPWSSGVCLDWVWQENS